MKKSWKPQVRSFFIYRIPFWIFAGIVSACTGLYFYKPDDFRITALIAIIYVCSLITAMMVANIWHADGYKKITIDTGKKLMIFDDKLKIPFKNVRSIEYIIENNPSNPLLLRSDIFFDNGRINLFKINARLIFCVYGYKEIDFQVQNKIAAFNILRTLKKCGFEVTKEDNRTFNFAFFIRCLIFISALIALAWIKFHP